MTILASQPMDVYTGIATRFEKFHKINIAAHIEKIVRTFSRLEQGFEFIPKDANAFEYALKTAGFEPDLKYRSFGVIPSIGTFAAGATRGQGFREPGSPSLHCAIDRAQVATAPGGSVAESKRRAFCSVHLDTMGFKVSGAYGPDAFQHIIDELLWQDKLVPALGKYLGLSDAVTDVLYRIHPIVPNSTQIRPYTDWGISARLFDRRTADLQTQIRVDLDVTHSCSDLTCGLLRRSLDDLTIRPDNKVMVTFKVFGM